MATTDSLDPLELALDRLAKGDAAALELIYRLSASRLLAVCLRILNDRGDAEDALHDTFLRLSANAGRYRRGRGSALGWLVTMARNIAIDRLRSRAVRGVAVPVDMAEALSDPEPIAEARLLTAESDTRLDGCLSSLEDVQQVAIRSAFFTGVSYAQLAQQRGVPLGTMKSWVRRGLAKLKVCLEQ
jgi:RNA polymerase sigma factor (sigma-70 family)